MQYKLERIYMRQRPLVSVIVTTRNEASVLGTLLASITRQTYPRLELIVVDNHSTDSTKTIAKQFTKHVFTKGPERSAQRNFGARKARGTHLLFLDADMTLEPKVIAECVQVATDNSRVKAIIIPEISVGVGFWAQCKALERRCYLGDERIEAARFFEKKAFWATGGYDERLTGPEDWDLPQKMKRVCRIGRIRSCIAHHEGQVTILKLAKKKFYYGRKVAPYIAAHPVTTTAQQLVYLLRPAFYRHWRLLLSRPHLFIGMVILLTVEQLAGFLGFLSSHFK